MQPGTLLRFLAPFALTALLGSCGGDDGGSTDNSSNSSTATSSSKHDGGLKTAVKHDAGKKPPADDTTDDSASDDSTDDATDDGTDDSTDNGTDDSDSRDAGKGCTTNADCHAGDAGIGCCDAPSNMCYVSHAARCPSSVTNVAPTQPPYK